MALMNFQCLIPQTSLFFDESLTSYPSLFVQNNQRWFLEAPNGIGKTSYLKYLLNFFLNQKIPCTYLPHDLGLFQYETIKTHQELFQSIYGILPPLKEPLWPSLERTKKIHSLSRGFQQRLAVSLRLVPSIPIWILDEPWTGLDQEASQALIEMIEFHELMGGCIFFTHHGLFPDSFKKDTLSIQPFSTSIYE
jgi:ABC-type multidrug transport system ATPase subunit